MRYVSRNYYDYVLKDYEKSKNEKQYKDKIPKLLSILGITTMLGYFLYKLLKRR